MPADVSPPPIVCSLSERRQGSGLRIEAEIRSTVMRSGSYRLSVLKQGSHSSAQINQASAFSVAPGSPARVQGPMFSLEARGRYRARLTVRAGGVECTCEREGPDAFDSL